jgi:hypothetical protein
MKQGSLFVLFCLYLWDPPNRDALDRILGLFGKLFEEEGCIAFGFMVFGLALQNFLNIEWFLHWKFN